MVIIIFVIRSSSSGSQTSDGAPTVCWTPWEAVEAMTIKCLQMGREENGSHAFIFICDD